MTTRIVDLHTLTEAMSAFNTAIEHLAVLRRSEDPKVAELADEAFRRAPVAIFEATGALCAHLSEPKRKQ